MRTTGPVHVMHVTQPVEGGTAAVVEQEAATDLGSGRTVTIVSPPGRLSHWASDHGARWVELPLTRQPGAHDVAAVLALRRLLPSADLACLHSSKAGAVGRLALATLPRASRPACVFTPHAWSWYVGGRAAPAYRGFERVAARWADVIVAVSEDEARDGRRLLPGRSIRKVVLIENGVDLGAFSPIGPVADRSPAPLVVSVGRLCAQKGQDTLIRAVARLEDRSVRLTLVGDGPDRADLQRLSDELGVEDRVDFIGQADPRPHYRAADLVVTASRWEGQSLVLLEAMASGATVVATPAASSGLGPEAGVTVTDGAEPAQLAATLADLLADPARRVALAGTARQFAQRHHSSERTARQYDELVNWISGRFSRRLSPPVAGSSR